jgi:NAD(P)-dependent dehydrogenase (short-subunit alcohol dehydrogenase family)
MSQVLCDVSEWNCLLGAFKAALALSPTATFVGVNRGTHSVDQIGATDMDADPSPLRTAELDVNLKGALYSVALALHYFHLPSKGRKDSPQEEDKSLIFVSSLAGYIDDRHNSVYTASKFGMRGL